MQKRFLLYLVLVSPLTAWSQEATPQLEKNMYALSILPLGGVWEHSLAAKHSVRTQLALSGAVSASGGSNSGFFVNYQVRPFAEAGYRYYYNLEKRQRKGKRTAFNSGNFLSVYAGYTRWGFGRERVPFSDQYVNTSSTLRSGLFNAGVLWGLQRTYRRKLNLNLGLGAGLHLENGVLGAGPSVQLQLGYVLNR